MVLGPDGSARPELFVKDRLHFCPRATSCSGSGQAVPAQSSGGDTGHGPEMPGRVGSWRDPIGAWPWPSNAGTIRTTSAASWTHRPAITSGPSRRSRADGRGHIGCGTSSRRSRAGIQLDVPKQYSIQSVAEAGAYLDHPLLGRGLVECAEAAMGVEGRSAYGDLRLTRRHEAQILRDPVRRRDALGFGVCPAARRAFRRSACLQDAPNPRNGVRVGRLNDPPLPLRAAVPSPGLMIARLSFTACEAHP